MRKHILFALLLASASLAAQDKNVTGQVIDAATGKPLAGVIVQAYGDPRYSTLTDEKGNYVLQAPEHIRSVIMRVDGYNLEQRPISQGVANGKLYQDSFSEFYKMKTTAHASAEAHRFENTSRTSIDPLIAEQLGGDVRTVNISGLKGLGNRMLVEGINSLHANAQPLIVIDGVVMDMQYNRQMLHSGYYNNLLANLNVNDIEKVEVLKNGTALYGAKAADGVILIQTKRNKSMATKIDVTINGQYELVPKLPNMMEADDYRLYATQLLAEKTKTIGSMKFLNNDPNYFYYKQYHNQTDWSKEVYENAFSHNYGINVRGGDNVASYNLSVGCSLGSSTLKKDDFSRFNMRLNTDIEVFRGLMVRFDASYSDVDRKLTDDGAPIDPLEGVITSPAFLGLAKAPFLSPYAFDTGGNISHYFAEADDYLEGMFQGKGRLANPTSILKNGEGNNRNSYGNRLIMFSITPSY